MSDRYVLGIDPGLTGAVAVLDEHGTLIEVYDLPTCANGAGKARVRRQLDAAALWEWLQRRTEGKDSTAFVERVSTRPGEGTASSRAVGDTAGVIRALLCARGIPLTWVSASRWKRTYGLGAEKELARTRASEWYPDASLSRKKDHNRAEAILLARWAAQILRGGGP